MPLLLLLVLQLLSAEGFLRNSFNNFDNTGDVGEPLFLTPYIEDGKIQEARELSRVSLPGDLSDIESYAGFITINKTYNTNYFVWYFPAEIKKLNVTIVWLQGGPGATSLFGLFTENGPIYVEQDKLLRRPAEEYWSQYFNVIYIDNPAGAGFSFTIEDRGYATNQAEVGERLYETLVQVYKLFPELAGQALVISGESYGGKHAPSLAYKIHEENPSAETTLALKGVTIGNGWCDPINQLDYAEYLYQLGLIGNEVRKDVDKKAETTRQLIRKKAWNGAMDSWNDMMGVALKHMKQISVYNYASFDPNPGVNKCPFCAVLHTDEMRKAIHVGNQMFHSISDVAYACLNNDFMRSVAPWISQLLEKYKVWFYNGQQDIIVAYPLTENVLRELQWSGRDEYLKARREHVYNEEEGGNTVLVGYSKTAGNLTESMIRGGGHMIPGDQPRRTLRLLIQWCINNNITQYRGNLTDL